MLPDRLSIFVSSTIGECAAERAVARRAIRSLNHEPVLFEDVGARPYPPRELYKTRLEEAHVFVAIYRESYGWVAPDMEISGLEDELVLAEARGMDRLIYILKAPSARQPLLEQMVSRVLDSGVTVGFYNEPDDLYDRIRDDLTAVVSNRFADQVIRDDTSVLPGELVRALVPAEHQLRRPAVEAALVERSEQSRVVVLTGPLGAGKTVLLAQVSATHGWAFIDARGLTLLEVLAQCANALRVRAHQPPSTFLNERAAGSALEAAWASVGAATLVVDGMHDAQSFWQILHRLNLPAEARIVIASRGDLDSPPSEQFRVPPLDLNEVGTLVGSLRGHAPDPGELADLVQRSAGNPLFLRFYAAGAAGADITSLEALELAALHALEPRVREVVFYVALAGRPLGVHALTELLGSDSAEATASLVVRGSVLLRQTRTEVEIIHEHVRDTIVRHLELNQVRLSFFSSALADYLSDSGDDVSAFLVLDRAGDQRRAAQILDRAAFQVSRRGGGRDGVPIFRARVERAELEQDSENYVMAQLALAEALQQTGDASAAAEALAQARSRAAESDDQELSAHVREIELVLQLQHGAPQAVLDELTRLRTEVAARGEDFHEARIALLLSAEYIGRHQLEVAADLARDALSIFERLGDEYGVRLSQLNLASALGGVPGHQQEVAQIIKKLDQSIDPQTLPRERAAVCNFEARRHRTQGRPEVAERFAREAVAIGETLGDKRLVSLNRINVGNALRDQGRISEALLEYRLADRSAASSGHPRHEAAANELIASVLNEQGDHETALVHATHSASVAEEANDLHMFGRAVEEQGAALEGLKRFSEAAALYANGARKLMGSPHEVANFVDPLIHALAAASEEGSPDIAVNVVSRVFGVQAEEETDVLGPQETIARIYALIPAILRQVPPNALVSVLPWFLSPLLASFPAPVEREIVLRLAETVLNSADSRISEASRVSALCGLLLATDSSRLSSWDLVSLVEKIPDTITKTYFKPRADGSAHWTVSLPVAQGVICTITQLDDSPAMMGVATIVALLLRQVAVALGETLLGVEVLPRVEVDIQVVSQSEFDKYIDRNISGLTTELEDEYIVSQSADVTSGQQPPIVVICGEAFAQRWLPGDAFYSGVHLMFGQLLARVAAHWLAREIEIEVVRPKITRIIRAIGAHPA